MTNIPLINLNLFCFRTMHLEAGYEIWHVNVDRGSSLACQIYP